jgi:hypothetical protein
MGVLPVIKAIFFVIELLLLVIEVVVIELVCLDEDDIAAVIDGGDVL